MSTTKTVPSNIKKCSIPLERLQQAAVNNSPVSHFVYPVIPLPERTGVYAGYLVITEYVLRVEIYDPTTGNRAEAYAEKAEDKAWRRLRKKNELRCPRTGIKSELNS